MRRSFGVCCLCGFLLMVGITTLTNVTIVAATIITGVLATASAILIMFDY